LFCGRTGLPLFNGFMKAETEKPRHRRAGRV
jgi:hypothetical protein